VWGRGAGADLALGLSRWGRSLLVDRSAVPVAALASGLARLCVDRMRWIRGPASKSARGCPNLCLKWSSHMCHVYQERSLLLPALQHHQSSKVKHLRVDRAARAAGFDVQGGVLDAAQLLHAAVEQDCLQAFHVQIADIAWSARSRQGW
jgi:hypothetical protein